MVLRRIHPWIPWNVIILLIFERKKSNAVFLNSRILFRSEQKTSSLAWTVFFAAVFFFFAAVSAKESWRQRIIKQLYNLVFCPVLSKRFFSFFFFKYLIFFAFFIYLISNGCLITAVKVNKKQKQVDSQLKYKPNISQMRKMTTNQIKA